VTGDLPAVPCPPPVHHDSECPGGCGTLTCDICGHRRAACVFDCRFEFLLVCLSCSSEEESCR
jgi:hypothetical protein